MARTLPDVPGVLYIRTTFQNGGASWSTKMHFNYKTAPPDATVLDSLANTSHTAFETFMLPQVTAQTSISETFVLDLSSKSSASGVAARVSPGTHPGAFLPDNCCVLYNWSVATRFKGGKARSYYPGGATDTTDDGKTWTSAFVAAFTNGVTNYLDAVFQFSGGTVISSPCLVSYYHGFTPITDPVTGRVKNVPNIRDKAEIYPIVGGHINNIIGSQRRRMRPR